MFEDFLNLNYWKINNKLSKIRELINRIGKEILPDTGFIFGEIERITERLNRLDPLIQNLGGWINPERKSPSEPGGGEPEEPPVEELLPDLIVDEIKVVDEDNYIDFEIIVKNQGKADSGDCILNVVIPSEEESNVDLNIPFLEIGETITLHHQYSFDKDSPLPRESKSIITTTDSTYIIKESNENNNTQTCQFDVLPQKVGLIVHIHNPEGLEIGSIVGSSDITLSHGIIPIDKATHGIPTILTPGNYTITVQFNGITIETPLTIEANICYEVFFTFPRTEQELVFSASCLKTSSGGWSLASTWPPPYPEQYYYYKGFSECALYSSHKIQIDSFDLGGITTGTYSMETFFDISSTDIYEQTKLIIDGNFYQSFPHIPSASFRYEGQSFIDKNDSLLRNVSFNVSIQTSFNEWYVQQLTENKYINGKIYSDPLGTWSIFCSEGQGYSYNKVPANTKYNELGLSGGDVSLLSYDNFDTDHSGRDIHISDEGKYEGSTLLKMSSIPYDIEGTAV